MWGSHLLPTDVMQAGVPDGPAGPMLAPGAVHRPSPNEQIRLTDAMREKEEKATALLDTVFSDDGPSLEIKKCAMAARIQLLSDLRTPRFAINAENSCVRAITMCPIGHEARDHLQEAQKSIRDVIVLRVQLNVPVGSRQPFISALRDAYDGEFPHKNTLANLMLAHRKAVGSLFPHAFVSKSCQGNAERRSGTRGRRTRDALQEAVAMADSDDDSVAANAMAPPGATVAEGDEGDSSSDSL